MAQKLVLFLHGYQGTPDNGFFKDIQRQLEKEDVKYISPNLPTPDKPVYSEWKNAIANILIELNNNFPIIQNKIIIVAHSLACYTILRMVDEDILSVESDRKLSLFMYVQSLILVAPIVEFINVCPQFTNYDLHHLKTGLTCSTANYPIPTYMIYSIDDNYMNNEQIYNFLSNFPSVNNNQSHIPKHLSKPKSKNPSLDVHYIEKNGFIHFEQDEIPFIKELVMQLCKQ